MKTLFRLSFLVMLISLSVPLVTAQSEECDLNAVTQDVGVVAESVGSGASQIYVIDEYHDSVIAQMQSAIILKRLHEQCGLEMIGLEGMTTDQPRLQGPFMFDETHLGIYTSLLAEGELSQAEFIALVEPAMQVVGIEDPVQYREALAYINNTNPYYSIMDLVTSLRAFISNRPGYIEILVEEVPALTSPEGEIVTTLQTGFIVPIAARILENDKSWLQVELIDSTTVYIAEELDNGSPIGIMYDDAFFQNIENEWAALDIQYYNAAGRYALMQRVIEAAQRLQPSLEAEDMTRAAPIYQLILPVNIIERDFMVNVDERSIFMADELVRILDQGADQVATIIGWGHNPVMMDVFQTAQVSAIVLRPSVFYEYQWNAFSLEDSQFDRMYRGNSVGLDGGSLQSYLDGRHQQTKPQPIINQGWFTDTVNAMVNFHLISPNLPPELERLNATRTIATGTPGALKPEPALNTTHMTLQMELMADIQRAIFSPALQAEDSEAVGGRVTIDSDTVESVPSSGSAVSEWIMQVSIMTDAEQVQLWVRAGLLNHFVTWDTFEPDIQRAIDSIYSAGLNSPEHLAEVARLRGLSFIITESRTDALNAELP
jgi:hypothetical protein